MEALIGGLQDPNEEVRTWCAWALGELKDPKAIKPLFLLLDDPSENVRNEAEHSLRLLQNSATVELIGGLLRDKNVTAEEVPVPVSPEAPLPEEEPGEPGQVRSFPPTTAEMEEEPPVAGEELSALPQEPGTNPAIETGGEKGTQITPDTIPPAVPAESSAEPPVLSEKPCAAPCPELGLLPQDIFPPLDDLPAPVPPAQDHDERPETIPAPADTLPVVPAPGIGFPESSAETSESEMDTAEGEPAEAIIAESPAPLIIRTEPAEEATCATADAVTREFASEELSQGRIVMQHFFDHDPHVQVLTIKAFEEAKSTGSVKILIQSLQNEHTDVRTAAVRALGGVADAESLAALAGALRDPAPEVQDAAKKAFAGIRSEAAIEQYLAAGKKEAGTPIDALVSALSDPVAEFRIWAAWSLGSLRNQQAVPHLIQTIREPQLPGTQNASGPANRILQVESAHALVKIGEPAIIPLIAKLNDKSEDFRRFAAAVLILQHESAIVPLIGAIRTAEPSVREEAVAILGRIGDAAVEPLIGTIQDTDASTRVLAIRALMQIHDPRSVTPLIASLKDTNEEVRTIAAHALGDLRDAKAIMPLIRALRDPCKQVRDQAVESLATIGDVLEVPA
jgi:HEAT repeat protein